MTTSPTQERTQATASAAADETGRVAGVAKDEAQAVAAEAADQVRGLANEAMSQVVGQLDEQSRTQRDRLVGTLHSLSDELEEMTKGNPEAGLATDLVRDAAGRARSLGTHLDGREPSELLDDVRSFARRRPGTFLLGALALGVVAGRAARGAKDAGSKDSSPDVASGGVVANSAASQPDAQPVAPAPPAPVGEAIAPVVQGDSAIPPSRSPFDEGTGTLDHDGPMGTGVAGYGERPADNGRVQ